MLILTRKRGEIITIGDDIKVVVLDVSARQVRLGVDAPEDIIVNREEIHLKIQAEKKSSLKKPSLLQEVAQKVKKIIGKHSTKPRHK